MASKIKAAVLVEKGRIALEDKAIPDVELKLDLESSAVAARYTNLEVVARIRTDATVPANG